VLRASSTAAAVVASTSEVGIRRDFSVEGQSIGSRTTAVVDDFDDGVVVAHEHGIVVAGRLSRPLWRWRV
jgi:hypothetical protein